MTDYFESQDLYPESIMIPPMLVNHIPTGKEHMLHEICTNGKYFAQCKKDGACYSFNRTEHYTYLFSRTVSKATNLLVNKAEVVPHICETLKALPPNTVLIGEIYYPGKTSKDIVSVMGCLTEEGIKRQKIWGPIHYYIHDIVYLNGKNLMHMGARARYMLLEKILKHYNCLNDYIELAEIYDDNIEEYIENLLAAGEEGAVIKNNNGTYEPGKRPAWNMIKVKQLDTLDVIVTGFCDPTKEYNGKEISNWEYWVDKNDNRLTVEQHYADISAIAVTKPYYLGWKNAIEVSTYINGQLVKIGTVSSGLTDELREAFAKNPEKYLNKVIEVQVMSIDKEAKTLRHPFFKRFREDKNSFECTLD